MYAWQFLLLWLLTFFYIRNEGISGFLRGVFPNALKVRFCLLRDSLECIEVLNFLILIRYQFLFSFFLFHLFLCLYFIHIFTYFYSRFHLFQFHYFHLNIKSLKQVAPSAALTFLVYEECLKVLTSL